MSTETYEIELVKSHSKWDYLHSLLATLTGLPKHEVHERLPNKLKLATRWGGQNFVQAARALGYNVNQRFIKFDEATPWPCVLRCRRPDLSNGWWALGYANGHVYNPAHNMVYSLAEFKRQWPTVSITSMLQIWMSSNNALLLSER